MSDRTKWTIIWFLIGLVAPTFIGAFVLFSFELDWFNVRITTLMSVVFCTFAAYTFPH